MPKPTIELCECEQPGHFRSGVRGILAAVVRTGGERPHFSIRRSKVERCDHCKRFAKDVEARKYLEHTIAEANTQHIPLEDVERYRQRARALYPPDSDQNTFAIDDDARISAGEDGGAWVSAWVWVPDLDEEDA